MQQRHMQVRATAAPSVPPIGGSWQNHEHEMPWEMPSRRKTPANPHLGAHKLAQLPRNPWRHPHTARQVVHEASFWYLNLLTLPTGWLASDPLGGRRAAWFVMQGRATVCSDRGGGTSAALGCGLMMMRGAAWRPRLDKEPCNNDLGSAFCSGTVEAGRTGC
ncbi:hypothetical protein V8C26DRAFT_386021 [Trichoderma gracile]